MFFGGKMEMGDKLCTYMQSVFHFENGNIWACVLYCFFSLCRESKNSVDGTYWMLKKDR